MRRTQEVPIPSSIFTDNYLERNKFLIEQGDDVIGRLAVMRLEEGDTLPDIARHFSQGDNKSLAVSTYPCWYRNRRATHTFR